MVKKLCFSRISRCYIEALPDEILADIVSRLPIREAVKTSIVSRRWRNLGPDSGMCRNLNFDFIEKKYKLKYIRKSVACVMKKHQGEEVDHMRIAFQDDCPNRLNDLFQGWFEFANRKQVRSLDFEVKTSARLKSSDIINRFHLCLSHMTTKTFTRLTTLSLKSVVVNLWDVNLLLTLSPNLETLLLENAPLNCLPLNYMYPLPKLKRLEILNCVELTDIYSGSMPNLESFKYVRDCIAVGLGNSNSFHVRFGDTPKLTDICFGGPLCADFMNRLQEHVPQLQKLQLDIDVECDDKGCGDYCWKSDPVTFPKHRNLKELELRFTSTQKHHHDTCRMDTAITIINAFPCLEKLTLKYEIQKEDKWEDDCDLNCFNAHECLKKVQVVGWSGLKSEVRFIRHLIQTSPNLQDMLLDPTPLHEMETSWRGVFGRVRQSEAWELDYAALVAKQLNDYLHKR